MAAVTTASTGLACHSGDGRAVAVWGARRLWHPGRVRRVLVIAALGCGGATRRPSAQPSPVTVDEVTVDEVTVDELVARLLGARGVFLRGDDGCEEWAVSRGDDGLTLRRQWIEPGWPRSDRDARLTVTRTIHVQAGGLALSPTWTREREQRRGPDGGWRPDGGLVGSTLCVADPALRRTDDGAGYVIGGAVLHLSRAACERPLAQPVAGCT